MYGIAAVESESLERKVRLNFIILGMPRVVWIENFARKNGDINPEN